MTCEEFEDRWRARLDGAKGPPPDAAGFESHRAGCPDCRALDDGYRALEAALGRWPAPPPASPIFAERLKLVLADELAASVRSRRRLGAVAWASGIAATLLAGLSLAIVATRPRPDLAPPPPVAADLSTLPAALALATSATYELARDTSAPAARLGRVVLSSASLEEIDEVIRPVEVNPPVTGGTLQSVGERVGEGVKPLTGSARRAFDFILGPAPESSPPADRAGQGA